MLNQKEMGLEEPQPPTTVGSNRLGSARVGRGTPAARHCAGVGRGPPVAGSLVVGVGRFRRQSSTAWSLGWSVVSGRAKAREGGEEGGLGFWEDGGPLTTLTPPSPRLRRWFGVTRCIQCN